MQALILGILGAASGAAVLFFIVCFGTLTGGIAGWMIGLIFDAPENFAAAIGVSMTNFDVGAMLGFAGGFIRATVKVKSSD